MTTKLVTIKPTEIGDILTDGEKMEKMLVKFENSALAEAALSDIETKEGRAAIRSLAALIPKSKAPLKARADELTESAKKTIKDVGDLRKKFDDRIDTLKVNVRKPLTDYEVKEKARVDGHKALIENWENFTMASTSEELEAEISELMAFETTEELLQEYAGPAEISKASLLNRMRAELLHVKSREDADALAEKNRIELEELRESQRATEEAAAAAEREREEAQAEIDRKAEEAAAATAAEQEAENQALRDQMAELKKQNEELEAKANPIVAPVEEAAPKPMDAEELPRAAAVPDPKPSPLSADDPEPFFAGTFDIDVIPEEVTLNIVTDGGKQMVVIYAATDIREFKS